MAELLSRSLAGARFFARGAISCFEAQISALSPGAFASIRCGASICQVAWPGDPLLRRHALIDQLCRLANRQPRVLTDQRRLRWIRRPGLDGHRAHTQCLRWETARAHLIRPFSNMARCRI